MKTHPVRSCSALLCLFAALSSCARGDSPGDGTAAAAATKPVAAAPAAARSSTAAPLQAWQRDLLQLAFDAASAFPREPHGKNRSRAQEQVVIACFQLDQPDLALAFATRIDDWRRGCAYADYAWSMAKRGDRPRALEHIALAEGVVKALREDPNAQDWRGDMIALKVARAHAALGDDEAAAKAASVIEAASAHAVDGGWAAAASDRVHRMSREDAERELDALTAGFATLSIGQQNVALATVAKLHTRFFAEDGLRARCERLVTGTWTRLAPAIRLTALAEMVRAAIANSDGAAARSLLATMRSIVEGHQWRAEDRLPEVARLIELTSAVGDRDRARADAEAALADWHQQRASIVDIYRAETLRPLAVAWHVLGERERALELFALVLEEGMENPNSRPRCDDFVDTCVTLAVRGIEPSASLQERLRAIRGGLGEPW